MQEDDTQQGKLGWKFWVIVVILGIVVVGVLANVRDTYKAPTGSWQPSGRSESVYAGDEVKVKKTSTFACLTERHMDALAELQEMGEEVFKDKAMDFLLSGSCVMFFQGDVLIVEESPYASPWIRVRPKGSVDRWWVSRKAVEKIARKY